VDLSAVIVTWNCREAVLGCLRSLQEHPPSVPWEAIVVDNGSVDGTVDAVRAEFPAVRVIANAANRGLAAANNQGIVAAGGSDLLICNPDVVWQAGAVDALLGVLRRRPRAAWVVPRLLHPDGTPQTSAGDLPTLAEALGGRQLARRRSATSGVWWDAWAHDTEQPIGRGHESAYLVRRRAVEEVGGQDERFRLDWEGVEWTARFRDAGWEVWFCPDAEVVHLGGASIRQVPYRWIVWSHLGMYRYFAGRVRPAARPALAAAVAARALVKLAGALAGVDLYEQAHRG
jgi:GT2 family glycosyltransferase